MIKRLSRNGSNWARKFILAETCVFASHSHTRAGTAGFVSLRPKTTMRPTRRDFPSAQAHGDVRRQRIASGVGGPAGKMGHLGGQQGADSRRDQPAARTGALRPKQPECTRNRPQLSTRINTTQYFHLFVHHNHNLYLKY